jgi:Xaa-Pro aminopeptidase
VGREFTPAQAQVYDWVLKAQVACVEMVKPGVTLPQIHRKAAEVLTEGMLTLGLLKGARDELITSNAFRRYFPHGTSHWLGMDVHDVGVYQQQRDGKAEPRPLEAGMVFTIEPGLYVQPSDAQAPAQFRDIGIRIEDDILVTATGYENLTADAPKGREEIQALKRA